MKVFSLTITAAAMVLLAMDMASAQTVVNSQSRPIRFGNWSAPKTISIAGSNPAKALLLKTCQMTIESARLPGDISSINRSEDIQQIDFISAPGTGQYWIGKHVPAYVFFADRIIGIDVNVTMNLKEGFSSTEVVDEASELSRRLEKLAESPFSYHATKTVQLARIFGRDVFGRAGEAPADVSLSDVQVSEHSLTVSMKTEHGRNLKLTFGPDLVPTSAEINGTGVLLLFDGVESLEFPTSSPKTISLPTPNGSVSGLSVAVDFPYFDESREERRFSTRSVVLDKTGLIWFGPERCQLFLWGNTIVGVEEKGTQLNIYSSSKRIPTSAESKEAFRAELNKFTELVKSGRLNMTAQFDAKALFPKELENQSETVVDEIKQEGNKLQIRLRRTDVSQDRFGISLNDDFALASKEVTRLPTRTRPSN